MYVQQAGMLPGWGPDAIVIPASDFESGRLPGICAVTGAPATANLRRRYSTTPGWVGCLFFINWFALLIAYVFTHQHVSGYLPVISSIAMRVERLRRTGSLTFFAGILAWLLAAFGGSFIGGSAGTIVATTFLVLGAIAFVTSITTSVLEGSALGIRGRVIKDGFGMRWVQLQGVHPAFVQAVVTSLR